MKNSITIDAVARKESALTCTDDTHLIMDVAESPVRAGGFDGGDTMQPFITSCEQDDP